MKLTANVFFANGYRQCSNGPSATQNEFTVHFCEFEGGPIGFSEEAAEAMAQIYPDDIIIVEDVCFEKPRLRAIPAKLINEKKWTMFGGNFIWTSDSRFFRYPIKIHDRTEG